MLTLDRVWRFFGTALSFGIFGVCGLIIGTVFFPLLVLFVRNQQTRTRIGRGIIGRAMRLFVYWMRLVGVLTFRVTGLEHTRELKGAVIAANHPSLIDVVFLIAWFPRSECVVKYLLWLNPCTRWALKAADYIPNRDPVVVLDTCIERVAAGQNLIVFPEGTRTTPGKAPVFSRGPATIAVRAEGCLLPVRIRCTPTTLTKAEPWYVIPDKRVLFELEILPPLQALDYLARYKTERQASKAMNEDLYSTLVKES